MRQKKWIYVRGEIRRRQGKEEEKKSEEHTKEVK